MVSHATDTKIRFKGRVFKCNNNIYIQGKGTVISVSIAGNVANLFMVLWYRKLQKKLAENSIALFMYSRYADDINAVAKAHLQDSVDYLEANDRENN